MKYESEDSVWREKEKEIKRKNVSLLFCLYSIDLSGHKASRLKNRIFFFILFSTEAKYF